MSESTAAPKSFEDAISELEQIVRDIESGNVPLEQSLQKYERGAFLIQHCKQVLTTAEKQIEQLSEARDGSMQSTPIDDPGR